MVNKYFDGILYKNGEKGDFDDDLIKTAYKAKADMAAAMEDLHVADAMDAVWI